jgi:hypothetical protein
MCLSGSLSFPPCMARVSLYGIETRWPPRGTEACVEHGRQRQSVSWRAPASRMDVGCECECNQKEEELRSAMAQCSLVRHTNVIDPLCEGANQKLYHWATTRMQSLRSSSEGRRGRSGPPLKITSGILSCEHPFPLLHLAVAPFSALSSPGSSSHCRLSFIGIEGSHSFS